nr:protein ALP1-like [Tanacetum cinerariifolium]
MEYGVVPDALDEYLQMGATTARKSLQSFCKAIMELAQFSKGNHGPDPFILLKAIASNDLWVWHALFGISWINNDVNVLRRSPIFNDLKSGKAPDVPFVANNVPYKRGYYLTDGIYQQWSVLIKSIKNPGTDDHKRILYKTKHEAAKKDVEQDFGVLKKKWKLSKHQAQRMSRRRLSDKILISDQTSNPTSFTNLNPKGCNRRRSKQRIENLNLKEHSHPVVTMADQRTMVELLRAPTKGYAEAIVVPSILVEQSELKHSLINMMTTDQFFRLEKDNPHDHIRWGSPTVARKRTLAFDSHLGGSCFKIHQWILSPSRTRNLRNEILNFQQRFDKYFHEAYDRYKDILRACPHHGGNLLERSTQDVLTIIENKSKVRKSRSKLVVSQVKACDVNSNSSLEIAKLTHAVNQQTSVVTTAMTVMLKQSQATPPPAPVKAVEETYVTCEGSGFLPSNTVANPKGKLKAITTRSCLVIDGPTVPTPPQSINPEVDERVDETFTKPDLVEYTIKVPPPPVQKYKPPELKYKALANLGASINLMPLFVWKKLGLPENTPTRINLELANRAICTPAGIVRDVFVPVGKFTFPADFVIVDYESDPRVPLIVGRLFLWTARALIDVHDFLEAPFPNQPSGNPTFSSHPELTSPKVINAIFDSEGCNVLSEKLLDLVSTKDLHPPLHDNPLSGSTTYFSNPLLEEFVDELPLEYDDKIQLDIESDLKEIEFLLYQDKYSILKDSIDQKDLANLADIFVDSIPAMFTDEHAIDYSSPPIFDEYNDDLEVESDVGNVYDDPFDSKGEKIKESKLLIDELHLPCNFHPPSEYDSFISQDFSGLMLCLQPTTRTKYLTQVSSFKKNLLKSLLVLFKIKNKQYLMLLWCLRILILLSMNLFLQRSSQVKDATPIFI